MKYPKILVAGILLCFIVLASGTAMYRATPEPEQEPVKTPTQAVTLELVENPVENVEYFLEPMPAYPEHLSEPQSLFEEKERETPVEPEPVQWWTDEEEEILAIIIYQEAGGDAVSDDTRLKVGSVFLNRVDDDRFPDTFYEVATAKGQYGRLHWTDIKWPDRAAYDCEQHAVERARTLARQLLESGERYCPAGVVFQSEYIQGDIFCHQDGIYFCY